MTKAFLRKDLLEDGVTPYTINHGFERPIDWSTETFRCHQPDDLDDQEFNLILVSPVFAEGIALARSIDFDFI